MLSRTSAIIGFLLASQLTVPADLATSVNSFGLDLHKRLADRGGNLVTSPWSIESALAMTLAGADGKTAAEMARTLHLDSENPEAVHRQIGKLTEDLVKLSGQSAERVANAGKRGGPATALEIHNANRLFGQKDHTFLKDFLKRLADDYQAPLEQLDFRGDPDGSRRHINRWAQDRTQGKIKDLIPPGGIGGDTRLTLANAIYLKAAWAKEFKDEPAADFHLGSKAKAKAPMLGLTSAFGYLKWPETTVVSVPYQDGALRFVLFLPDRVDGLAATEKALDADRLAEVAKAPFRQVELHFPRFKVEAPSVALREELIAMGMPGAFDQPPGSADFSRMAARTPNEYLAIGEVFHKAFIAVDKHGTEAAAATAVVMVARSAMVQPEPAVLVRVDRPFAFAIQHAPSGVCLFLGRVSDPR